MNQLLSLAVPRQLRPFFLGLLTITVIAMGAAIMIFSLSFVLNRYLLFGSFMVTATLLVVVYTGICLFEIATERRYFGYAYFTGCFLGVMACFYVMGLFINHLI